MKREMFRKLMAASLATVMTVGLAACGGEDAPASVESSAESTEESKGSFSRNIILPKYLAFSLP